MSSSVLPWEEKRQGPSNISQSGHFSSSIDWRSSDRLWWDKHCKVCQLWPASKTVKYRWTSTLESKRDLVWWEGTQQWVCTIKKKRCLYRTCWFAIKEWQDQSSKPKDGILSLSNWSMIDVEARARADWTKVQKFCTIVLKSLASSKREQQCWSRRPFQGVCKQV